MSFPSFTLKMRGKEAIRIVYEGQDLGVFDRQGLWVEYRKVSFPNENNPDKRYVIERAIETLEGKSPRMRRGSAWVDQWVAARPSPPIKKRSNRSPVSRLFNWLRRFRF